MAVRARTVSGRVLVAVLVLALVAAACSSGSDPDDASPTEDDVVNEDASDDDEGVQLGTGDPTTSEEDDAPTVVEGEPLDADAVGAVFARLGDWEVPDDDVEDFNRPAETLPPPRTGDTVDAPFPPEGEAEAPEPPAGPLEVLRFQPEGEVEVAPSLSITFNQPMVELSTLEQLDTGDVPATMTPEVEGRWEWIGTRTLRFEHESELIDRLPMATTYTVEVPAGTTSATGGELAEAVSWEFTTPPATVLSLGPDNDALPLEPIFVALFDQRVDPDAVLEVTTITADDEERPLRLATEAEVQQDDFASRMVEQALDGRWVAFRPTEPLTPDRAVKVRVGPDIPIGRGAERSARTTPAWRPAPTPPSTIVEHECGNPCEPSNPLFVRFNNPLDLDTFDPDAVEVDSRDRRDQRGRPGRHDRRARSDRRSHHLRGHGAGRAGRHLRPDPRRGEDGVLRHRAGPPVAAALRPTAGHGRSAGRDTGGFGLQHQSRRVQGADVPGGDRRTGAPT